MPNGTRPKGRHAFKLSGFGRHSAWEKQCGLDFAEPKQRVANGTIKVQYGVSSARMSKTREQRALRVRARAVEGFMTHKIMGCTLSRPAALVCVAPVTGRKIRRRLTASIRSVWVWSVIVQRKRTEASEPTSRCRNRAPDSYRGNDKSSPRPVKRVGPTSPCRLQNDRNQTDLRSRAMIERYVLIPKGKPFDAGFACTNAITH